MPSFLPTAIVRSSLRTRFSVLVRASATVWLCFLGLCGTPSLRAHVGNPHIVFEGRAGGFPVRVVVRQPDVVPGLAEVSVRVLEGTPQRITVLPLHWDAARKGAPAPDIARLTPGETHLYAAQLWLMTRGAYGVEVSLEGDRGGSVIVPVNSVAYDRKPMPAAMKTITGVLGLVLALGIVAIGFAGGRDSDWPVGQEVSSQQRRRGVVGAVTGVVLVCLAVVGGNRWRVSEDAFHTSRVLFKPIAHRVDVAESSEGARLELQFTDPRMGHPNFALVPDHGKLVHAFLIGGASNSVFAHVHPLHLKGNAFQARLPALPAGTYRFFADVTHEQGIAETITNEIHVARALADSGPPSDPDDSFSTSPLSLGDEVELAGGVRMKLSGSAALRSGISDVLEASLTDAQGHPVALQPYLRMLGHAVIERIDGGVFSHVHPAGTLSMAAARGFAAKSGGAVAAKNADATCGDLSALPEEQVLALGRGGKVGFPFVFPSAGEYAVWVQVKVDGRILTGAFRRTAR